MQEVSEVRKREENLQISSSATCRKQRRLHEKDIQGGDRAEHPGECRETVPTIEKIEKIVEVHLLQFSYQMVDVQLSHVHRQNGVTCAEDKCI